MAKNPSEMEGEELKSWLRSIYEKSGIEDVEGVVEMMYGHILKGRAKVRIIKHVREVGELIGLEGKNLDDFVLAYMALIEDFVKENKKAG